MSVGVQKENQLGNTGVKQHVRSDGLNRYL